MNKVGVGRIAILLGGLLASGVGATEGGPATRNVELTYTATIQKLPEGARALDLWLPVAQDTDGQTVSSVRVAYPEGGKIAVEPRYGNKVWHRRFEAPFTGDLREGALGAQIVFQIHRTEIAVPEAKALAPVPKAASTLKTYLEPNTLIPIDLAPIQTIAGNLKLEGMPPIPAARRIYDWLIDEFTYNYKAPGAGRGDVRWACDAKSGDCSDYNSVFLALCRGQGIPADHEFGFPIRTSDNEGRIASHHCWARFFVEGVGWIPIDPSEADKHPELRQYNFGSQSAGLMKFTHGRDLTLVPPQAGPPLNRFIHPYVEVDGRPHEDVKPNVYYKDLPK